MTNLTNDRSNWANKQFSAVIPVICKVFQTGKRFSAITQVICKVCHSGKQFSAVTPIILPDKLYK
jgi:hypothetical protein